MGRWTWAIGIVLAAAFALALYWVPPDRPGFLFLCLLGIFLGSGFAVAEGWAWYAKDRAPKPVAWRRLAASIAMALVVTVALAPWLGRNIVPPAGVLIASVVGAATMYFGGGRHVAQSLLAGLLAGCTVVIAWAALWALGATA